MKKASRSWAILCCIAMIIQMFTVVPAVVASESVEVTYDLSTTVEAGEKYIIVSNGYALKNEVANVSTANGGISLASAAVTVADGKITSEVTDDMIWDFAQGISALAGPYTTGFFITNGESKYLSRGSSGGSGVGPLNTSTYNAENVASKPHYCYWAFEDISADGANKSMFLFSSTSSDYVFFMRGAAAGFDAPGTAQSNMESSLANYPVQLYKVTAVSDPGPEDPDESVLRHELLFMSDTHSDMTGSIANFTNVRAILSLLKAEDINPEVISFGGDYLEDDKAYLVNWEDVHSTLTGVLSTIYPDAKYVFTTGNHDKETNGGISDAEFKRIFGFDRVGVSCVSDEYEIFHIGAQGNKSGVDKEIFYESDIQALDTYLASKVGSGKVIFIQTHWPLHRAYNWSWRDIANAGSLIDTLNSYGDDLDIVFLWGHNHYTDANRHTIKHPGDDLLYADGASKTIKFTYANVGCMNDFYPTQKPNKETTVGPGICLLVNIFNDKLVFTYNRLTGGNTSTPVLTHDANITISGTSYLNPAVTEIALLNPFDDDAPPVQTFPSTVSAAGGAHKAILTWSLIPDAIDYKIYISTVSGEPGELVENPQIRDDGETVTCIVDNLDVGTYYFTVKAVNELTESGLSNEAQVQVSDGLTVFIEGTQQVKLGEEFTLNVILNNLIKGVYAGDIILNYDDSLFELKSCDETGDLVKIVSTEQEQPGSIRVILATEGTAMNEGKVPLFNLDFIAKDTVTGESGSFTITKADFGIMPGGLVYSAPSTGIDILVEESWKAGDANKDGVINIVDLAIGAYYYQASEGDPNWSLAKSADVNYDGVVNIVDLSFIAQLILNG